MKLQSINRYEAYKDSGVEWLGEMPEHWEIVRNKDIFEERGSLSSSGDETLLTVSHITGVTRRSEKNVNMFMAETMEGYKHCKEGDLIINTMWAWMGALGTANEAGICSPAYGVYKPKKHKSYNRRYFDYLYRTPNAITEMTRNSKGIVSSRLRLYPKDFFQIQTALPVEIEQAGIANYLDTTTSQIDRKVDLLSQKSTQYSKLKQSLINETVTRGLDNTVTMKDIGVEWVGEVPEHWEVKRVKEVSTVFNGATPKSSVAENWDGELSWVTTDDLGKLNTKFITDTKRKITEKGYASCGTTICPIGSVVISGRAPIGHIGILSIKASSNQGCKTLVLNHKVANNLFIFYSLLSSKSKLEALGRGTTFVELSTKELGLFNLPMPSLLEQQTIVNYLDEKTAHINRIVATINTQIDKLKELRKTLINDVATGKIKVFDDNNRDRLTTDPFDYTKGRQVLDENLPIEAHATKRCY